MCSKDNKVDQVDVLNTIAGRITNIVKDIGTEPCKLCEGNFGYKGKCIGFSWDMTYFPADKGDQGTWNLSLYHHTKEIWYVVKDGTFVDIILAAYEKFASGEWRKTAKDTRRNRDAKK
jgi:hypothetical protein